MKSTIKIALGAGNEPCIHFNIVPSDDLRDQVCCQFLHAFGGESTKCHVNICGSNIPGSPITHMLEITPIAPGQMPQESLGLPSRHQIDDNLCTENIFDGQIVAVRFTADKVYYDILNKLTGNIIRDVDSCEITEDNIKLPQVPQPTT